MKFRFITKKNGVEMDNAIYDVNSLPDLNFTNSLKPLLNNEYFTGGMFEFSTHLERSTTIIVSRIKEE